MKRAVRYTELLLMIGLAVLSIWWLQRNWSGGGQSQSQNQLAKVIIPENFYRTHILGGFSIDSPERADKAAEETVQVNFQYGQPPAESSPLGQKLASLHMKVVDGYIASYLHYYECHRTATIKPPPPGQGQYCQQDSHPELADEQAFLANIAAHLQQVKNNHLVVGYWVLDDWVSWDAGSARQLLIKVHDLIQQYTPGYPAICGFGGSISPDRAAGWDDWIADNFSPQGCDMVGLYIYAASRINIPSDLYDWSMSSTLTAAFASLRKRGWDVTKQPLIGIGQAFGGFRQGKNSYWITPNAKNMETQSRSFCEHGASGIAFYGWHDSEFGATIQTPMNSAEIEKGIQAGVVACYQHWLAQKK